jgi:hypothetical protein
MRPNPRFAFERRAAILALLEQRRAAEQGLAVALAAAWLG